MGEKKGNPEGVILSIPVRKTEKKKRAEWGKKGS